MIPFRHTNDIKPLDISNVTKELQTVGSIVFHEQNLTESDYINTMKKFGECEAPDLFMNPKEHPEIFLVTDKYLGIPMYISVKNNHLSFEHTHPPHEYILSKNKFSKVSN